MKKMFITFVLLATIACNINVGSGKKIGQIVQLGDHGLFCTTVEGTLMRGGFQDGSGSNGGAFHFTVPSGQGSSEVRAILEEAMEKRKEVEVTYQHVSMVNPCNSSHGNFVVKVKVLN